MMTHTTIMAFFVIANVYYVAGKRAAAIYWLVLSVLLMIVDGTFGIKF